MNKLLDLNDMQRESIEDLLIWAERKRKLSLREMLEMLWTHSSYIIRQNKLLLRVFERMFIRDYKDPITTYRGICISDFDKDYTEDSIIDLMVENTRLIYPTSTRKEVARRFAFCYEHEQYLGVVVKITSNRYGVLSPESDIHNEAEVIVMNPSYEVVAIREGGEYDKSTYQDDVDFMIAPKYGVQS